MTDPIDAGPLLPECEFADDIPRDGQGCLPVGALIATTGAGCRIPDGECFSLYNPDTAFNTRQEKEPIMANEPRVSTHRTPQTPFAAFATIPDGVVDEAPAPASDSDPPPAAPVRVVPVAVRAAAPAPAEEKAAPLAGPPTAPVAHVSEAPSPATAVAELQALLPKDGSSGTGVTVMLALVAVGGGGAAWKFYQSFAKQKHEERMKELEIKAQKVENQNNDDHAKCDLARANDRAAWEAKVAALEARLAESEKRAPSLSFDSDDLEERLAQIESALKKAPSEKKKPKKG